MSYSFFFLLGIPFWLIPVAYLLRHPDALRPAKVAWAGATFLAPFAIFSVSAVGSLLVQQGANDANTSVRAFGYFVVLLHILAFFSPFVLQVLFRNLYGGQQA